MERCNQCGYDASHFSEGVCLECCDENQKNLDNHNASFDRWTKMSCKEQSNEIKDALRLEA